MECLARWAADRPDSPFLIQGRTVVSFAEANVRVAATAGGLRQRFPLGSRLGVTMTYEPDAILTALAVQSAGMVLVPLPGDGSDEQRLSHLAGLREVVVGGEGPEDPGMELDPARTSAAVFTTGTTGTPRAVRLTWANIAASAAASQEHLDHGADDRWLCVLPLHHVGGLSIVWRSAIAGSAVILAGPFDPLRTASILESGEATLGSFVGAMLEAVADVGLDRAPGFRHGLVGGGPASERALALAGMNLLATYGMTETASQVATADPADPDPRRLVPLRGVDLTTTDDGRITVDGPMVSPGYLDGPDRSGPLVTSDVGRLVGARLEVLGRVDDVIVTGGENVMPAAVEQFLSAVPGAGQVAVVGIPDDRWGQVVACVYTGDISASELEALARSSLPRHAVPRRWKRVGRLPSMGIGKVDRVTLRQLFG